MSVDLIILAYNSLRITLASIAYLRGESGNNRQFKTKLIVGSIFFVSF